MQKFEIEKLAIVGINIKDNKQTPFINLMQIKLSRDNQFFTDLSYFQVNK